MNSNYETLYGVGLLDDIHNYFPALLYDSSSFGNVQSVLGYIQRQSQTRFDLFSYGQREYLSRHPPQAQASENLYNRVVRTSLVSGVPNQGATPISTLRMGIPSPNSLENSILPTINTNIQIELNQIFQEGEEEGEEEGGEQDVTQMNLANALFALLTRNYRVTPPTMDQFLQPVVIHPTAEQIAQNTTLGRLVSDTEQSCAICQDTLTSEQEGRKLNVCGHWFHTPCIDTWFQGNVYCPVCRHDIREAPTSEDEPA